MKRLSFIAVLLLVGVFASSASADVTTQIPGFNCSVTSYTPFKAGSGIVQYSTGVSCGGSQFGYSKDAQACLQVRGADGVSWFDVGTTCGDTGWVSGGTIRQGGDYLGGVAGHVYRTRSVGQVQNNGVVSGADPTSQAFTMT